MTTTPHPALEAEEMAERIFAAVIDTMETLTVCLGDMLGYYAAVRDLGSVTVVELAAAAGTAERYAREWLEQQAIIGILLVDDVDAAPGERRYSLPAGHAEALTDPESLAYIAPFARVAAAAAARLGDIAEAHRSGGGVSWDDFGQDMREGQGAANKPIFMGPLGEEWFPSIPEIHAVLTAGGRVADIATGFGWSAIGLARAYPGIRVDGYDIDGPSIEAARENAEAAGVADRVTFHHADAGELGVESSYDLVTIFEAVHDLPYPVEVLRTMRKLAGDGGLVVVMDEAVADSFGEFDNQTEHLMYGFSNLVCLPDGMSHPGSVGTGTVMRPSVLRRYAVEAGFAGIEVLPIDAGLFRFYRLV